MTTVLPVLELPETLAPLVGEGIYLLDNLRSRVAFSVRHLTGRVHGVFNRVAGVVNYDPQRPEATNARVIIQAASVMTHHEIRDTRLRSPGFFDVRAFPQITFVSHAARRAGRHLELLGELTIHGVSRPVTIRVGRTRSGGRAAGLSASARALVQRSEFGVGPNSRLENGGLLIFDQVAVEMDLELVRHPA
jgi:polyisoprenoid-binding protein YceI